MSAVFDRHGLTVTPANVLGIRTVIMTDAEELQVALDDFKPRHSDGMPVLGGDPVSPYAARGFTECTNAYLAQCQARIEDIPGMNHELACQRAQQLAEYLLTALKARQPS